MSFCKAKFKGTCKVCEKPINVGEFIVVLGKGNCRHKDCIETNSIVVQGNTSDWIKERQEALRNKKIEEAYEENMMALGKR